MNPKIKHSRDRAFKRFVYIFFFLMCACFVLPLIVVISASFTSEQALTSGGFSLLPRDFTLDAYKSAFSSGTRVLRAYGVTIFQAVVGTVLSSLVAALAAYPLSRSNFRFRRPITVFIFFTMLFSAGMIPNYIIFAKYYKLADSIWIYILPGITGGAWNTPWYSGRSSRACPRRCLRRRIWTARVSCASSFRSFCRCPRPFLRPLALWRWSPAGTTIPRP